MADRPQLVHSARVMFETRIAKYNDPHNLEWEWDDITDKWERHALSAFMDLKSVEAERDALHANAGKLREVLEGLQEVFFVHCYTVAGVIHAPRCGIRTDMFCSTPQNCERVRVALTAARAVLAETGDK